MMAHSAAQQNTDKLYGWLEIIFGGLPVSSNFGCEWALAI